MRNRLALIAAFGAGLGVGAPALADGPVVLELFTSQGCSSCPPADDLLGQLAEREDVIALALHVNYWDYIGWEDTFATPQLTERQHYYGHAAGSTVVYTPQMVIGGVDHVIGTRAMEVADLIAAHMAQPDPVDVDATPTGDGWQVQAVWVGDGTAPQMVVQVVTYSPHEVVEITRGENAGLTVDYHNIVRSWQVVSDWSGATPFEAQVMPTGDMPHVVIVQADGHGAILGAARLD
ncbi:thioredoxin family protein [Hasllibacter sp. MH4015]|uniref:DUF1223 domain-containing protein n=1 Tax=Hasllibacter sp. MH4015 TaxID=2854029 RepID=UPI001CD41CD4|nr:DUF1223 domain-containing protein [Hasllibacter sp. MH4015]